MDFAVSYIDKYWYRAVSLDHCVKFDRTLGLSESRPREHRQTQIDSRRIQCVGSCVEVEAQICVGVEWASYIDECVRKIGVDSPIATFVGIGKRRSSYWSFEPAVIQLAALCSQTDLDVAKALAIGQLGEGHGEKLVPAPE